MANTLTRVNHPAHSIYCIQVLRAAELSRPAAVSDADPSATGSDPVSLLDVGERRMSVERAISPPDLSYPDDDGDDEDAEMDDVTYFHTDSKSPIPVTSPAKRDAPGPMIPIRITQSSLRDTVTAQAPPPQPLPQNQPVLRKSAPASLATLDASKTPERSGSTVEADGARRSYGEGLRMWWAGKVVE